MLAKLLSLLIHAKSGAISGVLLLGATGALVSVSASNGVTTITITEASPSPVSLVSHTTEKTIETETPKPAASPKLSSVSSTACTDEATALATEVQRVDSAFSGFHTDLMKLRGQRAATTIETADTTLKDVRQAAVEAIHATATQACAKQDDQDANQTDNEQTGENDTNDATSVVVAATTTSSGKDNNNAENNGGDHGKTTVAPVTFTGDATSIATQAIGLMQAAFDAANSASAVAPKPAHSPELKTNDSKKTDSKGSSEHHD